MHRKLPLTTHSIAYSTNFWLSNILGIKSRELKWNTSRCSSVNIPRNINLETQTLLNDISFHEFHMGKLKTLFDMPSVKTGTPAEEHIRSLICFMRPENTLYDVVDYIKINKPWVDLSEYEEVIFEWFEPSMPMRVPCIKEIPCSDLIYRFRNDNMIYNEELYRRLVWYQAVIDSTLDNLNELLSVIESYGMKITSVYRNFIALDGNDVLSIQRFCRNWSIFNDYIEMTDTGCTVIFKGSLYEIQYQSRYQNKQRRINVWK